MPEQPKEFFARVETITPEFAEKALHRSEGRNFRSVVTQARVDAIARAMREGKYDLNGESVKFDPDGYLIDGQHRLWACVESQVPFRTLVAYNVTDDINIDTGKQRSFADFLRKQGEKYANHLAVTLSLIYRKRTKGVWYGSGRNDQPQNQELLKLLRDEPHIRDASIMVHDTVPRSISRHAMIAAFYHEARAIHPATASWFLDKLATGAELRNDEPVKKLRDRMIADKNARAKLPSGDMLALVIKAWNMTRDGRTCQGLVWRGSGPGAEDYPELR